jgi:peptidoglycan/LPS O-acetylase OafA/YrhL
MTDRKNSLDLLRTLAIFAVVTAHSVLAYGAPKPLAPLQLGGIGVDLFFVLSGWLLGGQLARELKSTGSINVTKFWTRRWLRTLPAYYAVLFFTLAEQLVSYPSKPLRLDYLLFLRNYAGSLPYFYVSWSLCVEEHFYLLIAPMLLLVYRLPAYRWGPIVLMLATPWIFRQLGWFGSPEQSHVRWDGCMLGVALAQCEVFAPKIWTALTRFAPTLAAIAMTMLVANLIGRYHPALGLNDYDPLVYALVFGSILLLATRNAWWQQRLYIPGFRYIALRSYSIYLLHPEILALLKRITPRLSFAFFFALACVGSCLLAELLYRLIEKPFMQARERLAFARAN